MTWNAMAATRACDVADFWIAAPWPMTSVETNRHAAALGWTVDDEDFLEDSVSGLSRTDVGTSTMPSGELASLDFRTTDVIREAGTESAEFLDDSFTLVVREGTARWGRPRLEQTGTGGQSARWELDAGGRIDVVRAAKCVRVDFTTPQYARVLRELGE